MKDLHDAIMNLPDLRLDYKESFVDEWSTGYNAGYKAGHRDARHAAAELVIAAIQAQPAADLTDDELVEVMPSNFFPHGVTTFVKYGRAVLEAQKASK